MMQVAALALSTLTGVHPAPGTPPWLLAGPVLVTWGEAAWSEGTESSVVDEDLTGFPEPESPPHVALEGCELTLAGGFDAFEWSRELWFGAPPARIVANGHTDKDGRWVDYEQIARRPGRPEAYAAYRYPVAGAPVVSGYDLDKPDDEQRRGRMNAVGHGGVDLVAEMAAPVVMVRLEHQVGDAEVLYVGPLYGETVVTRHVVREGGRDRDYLLIFGHLDRAAEDVRRGRLLPDGARVGYVGNTGSPELVHLHLEARRVRDGVDAWRLPVDVLDVREQSVVCDPRNVLPLARPPLHSGRCAPRPARAPRPYWLGAEMTLSL